MDDNVSINRGELFYWLVFGLLSVVVAGWLFRTISAKTGWAIYPTWMVAINLTTFCIYGLDKLLAALNALTARVPISFLDVLALLGGWLGGWAGIAAFHHKINKDNRKNWEIWFWLTVSTILHTVLFLYWALHTSPS